ncbi:MAG: DUF1622 domain-containing protein [Thermomicrobiales bacterium]|nr:DUF1622 domain-containing protein [Thermomicrobiales bacterium]
MIDKNFIYGISEIIDYTGVAIIAVGAFVAIVKLIRDLLAHDVSREQAYVNVRAFLGRSLLLGLELLVAGDVIKTVAVEATMENVLVLALLVVVRTILSVSIDIEVDGQFPWQASGLALKQQELTLKQQELELREHELERPHSV